MSKFRKCSKKQLAARVLCTLLLGTYLTGGYSEKVLAGEITGNAKISGNSNVHATGLYASAWGEGTDEWKVNATGEASTAFGWGETRPALLFPLRSAKSRMPGPPEPRRLAGIQ